MSFLKINDPTKRDFIVQEFLKSKKNIKRNFLSERLGDIGLQQDLAKLYKPIVDSQSEQKALLTSIKESSAALPRPTSLKAIQFPQYPSIEAYEDPIEDIRTLELGDLATKYLKQYASDKKVVDTTFGIKSKDGQFYIGNTQISIEGDDVTVGNKTYQGTPGLWELLTMSKPDNSIFNAHDYGEYAEILDETNAIRQPNNPTKPKSSRGAKYNQIIKPIWDMKVKNTPTALAKTTTTVLGKKTPTAMGTGIPVITIPSDPNELVKQLELRMYSYEAGNTGVRNEIVAITDELLRQGVINKEDYKKLVFI